MNEFKFKYELDPVIKNVIKSFLYTVLVFLAIGLCLGVIVWIVKDATEQQVLCLIGISVFSGLWIHIYRVITDKFEY